MSFSGLEPGAVVDHASELGTSAEQFVNVADRITAILASVESEELGGGPQGTLTEMSGSSQELAALLVDKAAAMLDAASGLDFGAMDPLAALGANSSVAMGNLEIGGVVSEIADFLAGDILRLWNGGDDDFPIGKSFAKGIFIGRTAWWLRLGAGVEAAAKFPVFNTGLLGKGATKIASSLGQTRLSNFLSQEVIASDVAAVSRATFKGGPAAMGKAMTATKFFRGLGIAGSAVSTVTGAFNIARQGNPVDAFQNDPSGYVSDIAETAFSASTTAFLLAPTPVTAGAAVATGVVWAGTEVWDNWDDVTDFAGKMWDTWYNETPLHPLAPDVTPAVVVEAAGEVWDRGVEIAGEATVDFVDGAVDLVDDLRGLAKGPLGAIGGLF